LILGSIAAPSSEFSAVVLSTPIVVAPAHLAAALRHFLPAAAGSLRLVFWLPGCLSVFEHHFLDRRRLRTDHCALVCHSTLVVFDLLPHCRWHERASPHARELVRLAAERVRHGVPLAVHMADVAPTEAAEEGDDLLLHRDRNPRLHLLASQKLHQHQVITLCQDPV
jgi:hypothetical protein